MIYILCCFLVPQRIPDARTQYGQRNSGQSWQSRVKGLARLELALRTVEHAVPQHVFSRGEPHLRNLMHDHFDEPDYS